MLGPEVEKLRQAIGRRDIGVIVRSTKDLEIALEHASNRIGIDLWMQCIRDRCLEGLVMLGEWSVTHHAEREEACHTFRIHDERVQHRLGFYCWGVIGYIGARLFLAVPFDQLALRVPGFTFGIT